MNTDVKVGLTIPVLTTAAVMAAIVGAFYGSGAAGGTPVQDAAQGRLGADGTLLAPGTGAFSIWSLVYAGLAVYAIWQLTHRARRSSTQRSLRPLAAASAILNALWLGVVQLNWLGFSVVVMLVLLLVLIRIFMLMAKRPMASPAERWIMWLTFGPYLGWVSVAAVANIAAWLASLGLGRDASWIEPAAIGLCAVAALIGAATVVYSRGHVSVALAMIWGIAWIGVGRSDGGLTSSAAAIGAFVSAGLLLVFAAAAAWRLRSAAPTTSRTAVHP